MSLIIDCLLGESRIEHNFMLLKGTISYVNFNDPFFISGTTIRSNILFGDTYNPRRYKKVRTALNIEMERFVGGDKMIVSNEGKNLSDVEKTMILMARFLYKERDVYIVENYQTLSNTTYLANYEEALNNLLLHKTTIYITNERNVEKLATKIYRFQRGTFFTRLKSPPSRSPVGDKNPKAKMTHLSHKTHISHLSHKTHNSHNSHNAQSVKTGPLLFNLPPPSAHYQASHPNHRALSPSPFKMAPVELRGLKMGEREKLILFRGARESLFVHDRDISREIRIRLEADRLRGKIQDEFKDKSYTDKLLYGISLVFKKIYLGDFQFDPLKEPMTFVSTFKEAFSRPTRILLIILWILESLSKVFFTGYIILYTARIQKFQSEDTNSPTVKFRTAILQLGEHNLFYNPKLELSLIFCSLFAFILISFCQNYVFIRQTTRYSNSLHDQLTRKLLHQSPAHIGRFKDRTILEAFLKNHSCIEHTLLESIRQQFLGLFEVIALFGLLLTVVPFGAMVFLGVFVLVGLWIRFKLFPFYFDLSRLVLKNSLVLFEGNDSLLKKIMYFRSMKCSESIIRLQAATIDDNLRLEKVQYIDIIRWFFLRSRVMIMVAFYAITILNRILRFTEEPDFMALILLVSLGIIFNFQENLRQYFSYLENYPNSLLIRRLIKESSLTEKDDFNLEAVEPQGGLTIQFKKVSLFNFGRPLLSNISFTLHSGKTYCLVSLSQLTKAAIFKLIIGCYMHGKNNNFEGQVLARDMGTIPVYEPITIFKGYYYYLMAKPILFEGTIRENLVTSLGSKGPSEDYIIYLFKLLSDITISNPRNQNAPKKTAFEFEAPRPSSTQRVKDSKNTLGWKSSSKEFGEDFQNKRENEDVEGQSNFPTTLRGLKFSEESPDRNKLQVNHSSSKVILSQNLVTQSVQSRSKTLKETLSPGFKEESSQNSNSSLGSNSQRGSRRGQTTSKPQHSTFKPKKSKEEQNLAKRMSAIWQNNIELSDSSDSRDFQRRPNGTVSIGPNLAGSQDLHSGINIIPEEGSKIRGSEDPNSLQNQTKSYNILYKGSKFSHSQSNNFSQSQYFNEEVSDKEAEEIRKILDMKVEGIGANIDPQLRKKVSLIKAILRRPRLLLIEQKALYFPSKFSVEKKLQLLRKELPETTLVCSLQDLSHLLFFENMLLLDGSRLLEKGEPRKLVKNTDSFLYSFLKTTNRPLFERLLRHLTPDLLTQSSQPSQTNERRLSEALPSPQVRGKQMPTNNIGCEYSHEEVASEGIHQMQGVGCTLREDCRLKTECVGEIRNKFR